MPVRLKLVREIGLCESSAADPALKYFDENYGGGLTLTAEAEFHAVPRCGDLIRSHQDLVVRRVYFHHVRPNEEPATTLDVERPRASSAYVDDELPPPRFDDDWVLHPDAEEQLWVDLVESIDLGWTISSITAQFQKAFVRMLDDVTGSDDADSIWGARGIKALQRTLLAAKAY